MMKQASVWDWNMGCDWGGYEQSTWERVILRRIHGPVVEQGIWRVNTEWELRELYKDLDIVADIGMGWTCSTNGLGKNS
jgi:hypothetical protein